MQVCSHGDYRSIYPIGHHQHLDRYVSAKIEFLNFKIHILKNMSSVEPIYQIVKDRHLRIANINKIAQGLECPPFMILKFIGFELRKGVKYVSHTGMIYECTDEDAVEEAIDEFASEYRVCDRCAGLMTIRVIIEYPKYCPYERRVSVFCSTCNIEQFPAHCLNKFIVDAYTNRTPLCEPLMR